MPKYLINCRNGMLKQPFGDMTIKLNIFYPQRQHTIFDDFGSVNWLEVYTCDDSYANGLIKDNICNEIDSLSPDLLNPLLLFHILMSPH